MAGDGRSEWRPLRAPPTLSSTPLWRESCLSWEAREPPQIYTKEKETGFGDGRYEVWRLVPKEMEGKVFALEVVTAESDQRHSEGTKTAWDEVRGGKSRGISARKVEEGFRKGS